ncbi:hypothetical protein [Vibrio gallicus]|uniref:hypothetical protein n=1 Tax=Vibrio gallicus TaxID=190897 RepID=UPI0021C2CEAF|nr:hypothetical protein [Vibrio gallicus]
MTFNKTGIAIALSAAFLFSGSVLADYKKGGSSDPSSTEVENYVDDGNSNKQWSDSANAQGSYNDSSDSSDNSDQSTTASVDDSFNIDSDITSDSSKNLDIESDSSKNLDVKDSFNIDSDSSKNVDIKDSFNHDSRHETTFDLDVEANFVVANSELNGEVDDNDIDLGSAGQGYKRGQKSSGAGMGLSASNTLNGMDNVSGITTVAQNSGANSLVQQSVNTNASLHTD